MEKISFSLKLLSGHFMGNLPFYGQSSILFEVLSILSMLVLEVLLLVGVLSLLIFASELFAHLLPLLVSVVSMFVVV